MSPVGYVTAQDAANHLGITVRQVRRLCTAGVFKGAEKPASDWLIPERAVAEYAALKGTDTRKRGRKRRAG